MVRCIDFANKKELRTVDWYTQLYAHAVCAEYYPEFDVWYNSKIVGHIGLDRVLICATINASDNDRVTLFRNALPSLGSAKIVVGIAILKNTLAEKKICTLRVNEAFRGKGIGSCLIEQAFEELETDKPLMTVPEETLGQFGNLLRRYDFRCNEESVGMYRHGFAEYLFNLEYQLCCYDESCTDIKTKDLLLV